MGGLFALVASAHAADLSVGFQETVASEEFDAVDGTFGDTTPGRFYHISVNPDNAGYASYIALDTSGNPIEPYTRPFAGPVVGWSFIGGGTNGELTVDEESGGLVSWTTTDETDPVTNTFDSFGQNQKKFWNATDPGPNFNLPSNEEDVGSTTHDRNVIGYRSFGQATATIDVSGLESGTAVIFYGAFSATPVVDAVLRDTDGGAPDIVLDDLHLNEDAAQRTEFYVAEVEFETDGVYDTIVYNYLQPGGEPDGSGNGRSGGIVVTGPAIPGDYENWSGLFPDADLADRTADLDGDGVSNDEERLFGLDPTDPTSVNPIVVPLDPAAGTLSFTRRDDSLTGLFTAVDTSTDLVNWTEDTGAALVEGSPDGFGVETIDVTLSPELLGEPRLFVRIRQDEGVLFSTGFETDDSGFTVETASGTDWERGAPDTSGFGGTLTAGNDDSINCWATNLGDVSGSGDEGYYDNSSGTSTVLRSPVIDLSSVAGARLSFAEALDIEGGDVAEVYVIDNATDAAIGSAIHTATDDDTTGMNWATVGPIDLPAGAAGSEIYLEWRFTGQADQFAGWYIDDVTLFKAAP